MGGLQVQKFMTDLTNMVKPVSTKNTKISQVWCHAPEIPATMENFTNPRGGGCSEPRPRHCTGWQSKAQSQKKKISWAWWWAPVMSTAQEAEAGESLKPRRQKLP